MVWWYRIGEWFLYTKCPLQIKVHFKETIGMTLKCTLNGNGTIALQGWSRDKNHVQSGKTNPSCSIQFVRFLDSISYSIEFHLNYRRVEESICRRDGFERKTTNICLQIAYETPYQAFERHKTASFVSVCLNLKPFSYSFYLHCKQVSSVYVVL